jgi:hypothetical protein
MAQASVRGLPSNVRGWLSEVYMGALCAGQTDQLVRRLGERATVDDPIFGRATGVPALALYLEHAARWLAERGGTFETSAFTTGSDRDVTEGTLHLTVEEKRIRVPFAVVAERRPEREVEIRLYGSVKAMRAAPAARTQLVPRDDELGVPEPVAAYLRGLFEGDADAVVGSFEPGASVLSPSGASHTKDENGGALRAFYETMIASGRGAQVEVLKGARADDGRTFALEYTVARGRGGEVALRPGLDVYERGETGLLRGVRIYREQDLF